MAVKAEVDTSFDAEIEGPLKVTLAGVECTIVDDPPAGAIIVFSRRMQQDVQQQLGAVLELLDKWVTPDDLPALYDAVGNLSTDGIAEFMEKDLAGAIQAVAARPT
jgi:hypothetical protein